MKKVKQILKRTFAMVILKISGVMAAGSLGGIEIWQSALIAAFVGVMEVTEDLSRAYVLDGHISDDDINAAFAEE